MARPLARQVSPGAAGGDRGLHRSPPRPVPRVGHQPGASRHAVEFCLQVEQVSAAAHRPQRPRQQGLARRHQHRGHGRAGPANGTLRRQAHDASAEPLHPWRAGRARELVAQPRHQRPHTPGVQHPAHCVTADHQRGERDDDQRTDAHVCDGTGRVSGERCCRFVSYSLGGGARWRTRHPSAHRSRSSRRSPRPDTRAAGMTAHQPGRSPGPAARAPVVVAPVVVAREVGRRRSDLCVRP